MSLLSRNTISIGLRPFGEVQSKTMRAYAQSGQYHTIVESRVHSNIVSESCLKLRYINRILKCRTKDSKTKRS